jgi:glutamate-1-semialdehyde 2,1-aminomutase
MIRSISDFTKSNEFRSKIHSLIPGGAHTYSKGDDQFPLRSPAAITHGKGAYVWDLDGNQYLDCSMGLTSVGLGHAYEPVIERIKTELGKGVNFQRPASIEMEMAERFLSLVPQHDMIKFGKNGSLVITAAIKLSRAYNGRKLIAFPSDHPFYSYDDWFIGKTACNSGIPEENVSLSVTYNSGDLKTLEALFEQYPNQISCVISEPERCSDNFFNLPELIAITHKYGALYIQDEMITGFKTALAGSINKYNTQPDMATWGKGIANGFSFCALTGKKEVMELGGIKNIGKEKVFLISTTHGGETTSIAAGLATIDVYEKQNVLKHNHSIGDKLIEACSHIILKNKLEDYISLTPTNWMQVFTFKNNKKEICSGSRTLMMQEMIKRGILYQGAFVPCFSHTDADVNYFAEAFDESLQIYLKALEDGYEKYLIGEPAKPVFRKIL